MRTGFGTGVREFVMWLQVWRDVLSHSRSMCRDEQVGTSQYLRAREPLHSLPDALRGDSTASWDGRTILERIIITS
jgi:hypothetical protein